jgi:flagellar biosynthesis protein FlhB
MIDRRREKNTRSKQRQAHREGEQEESAELAAATDDAAQLCRQLPSATNDATEARAELAMATTAAHVAVYIGRRNCCHPPCLSRG